MLEPANRLKLFLALVLFMASATCAHAQSEDDLPFDVSNVPSAEDIKALLLRSGMLDGLTEDEKQQQIDYFTKTIILNKIMSSARSFGSCQTEVDQFCSTEPKSDVNSCLFQQIDKLSICCAANVRSVLNKPGISKPMDYKGFKLPKGSELQFYDGCQLGAIDVPEEIQIGELLVGPGRINLDRSGNTTGAWLSEGQNYKGLPIKNNTEHGTSLYQSGVPVEVTVASDVNYLGMTLEQNSKVGFHENGGVSFVNTGEPFTDKHGRTMIGQLHFHPNGNIKLGHLARSWTKSKINLPALTGVRFNENGEFESIHVPVDTGLPGFKRLWGEHETYANGQIKTVYLRQHQGMVIDGIAYPEYTTIEFDENGSVTGDDFRDVNAKSAHPKPNFQANWVIEEISEPNFFGVWEIPAGSIIKKDEQGILRSATLASEIRYNDYVLNAGHIEFHSKGSYFRGATLAIPLKYKGLSIPMGSDVTMGTNGRARYVSAKAKAYFNGNQIVSDTSISFHNTGEVKEIALAPGSQLFGNRFSKPVTLHFFDTGKLQSLAVNVDARVNGTLYAAGTEIKLNEEGRVIHSWRLKPRWPNGRPPEPPKTSSNDGLLTPTVLVSPERPIRAPLSAPLSDEQCTKWFGEKDASGTYKGKLAAGMLPAASMSPARYGCGTTPAQAGILD